MAYNHYTNTLHKGAEMRHIAPRWRCRQPLARAALNGVADITPLQMQVLRNRGVTEPELMRQLIAADRALISDPAGLPDMGLAIERIGAAIGAGERICVIGDCDVDGLTATAIVAETLAGLGARQIDTIVMPRSDDGRGLTEDTARMAIDAGARLVITVDNGSSSVAEVAMLREAGIDTIVTDHHHVPERAPAALALVNPQRLPLASDPREALSGAGVAWQLARALLAGTPEGERRAWDLVDLAGLGTLADIVPLTPENHTIIALGLRQMNARPRPGLRALLDQGGASKATFSQRTISFSIAPRLNAAGRLGDPQVALALLRAIAPGDAARAAADLAALNAERQQKTDAMLAGALAQAEAQAAAGDPIIFVRSDDWSLGLVGLVAGRLADEYDRLAVAVACTGATCRGSLRGPGWFHIAETLASFAPALDQAGGHAQAGGFTTSTDRLDALRRHLSDAYRAAQASAARNETPLLIADAVMPIGMITTDRCQQVQALMPFGADFSEPLFASPNARITRAWVVGGGAHLKLAVEQDRQQRMFFWRRGGAMLENVLRMRDPLTLLWRMPAGDPWGALPEPMLVAISPYLDPEP